jgi:hypothetical protein
VSVPALDEWFEVAERHLGNRRWPHSHAKTEALERLACAMKFACGRCESCVCHHRCGEMHRLR